MRLHSRLRLPLTVAALALAPWALPHAALGQTTPPEVGLTPTEVLDIVDTTFPDVIDTEAADTESTTDAIEVGSDENGYTIPVDAVDPIDDLVAGTSFALPEPESANQSGAVAGSVVHTDLYESTSAIVTPTSNTSLEIYYLMHDADAPTTFTTELSLEAGSTAEQKRGNLVHVVDAEGAVTMSIAAPWAWDATGREIPVTIRVGDGLLETSVDLPDEVVYPVLVDPAFYTHGDYVHRTSNTDGTIVASGHGWWTIDDCGCLSSESKADVTVRLYNYYGGKWHMVEEKSKRVKPSSSARSAPSSRRANARDVCSSFGMHKWYSTIDVDVVGVIDSGERYKTATQTLACRA